MIFGTRAFSFHLVPKCRQLVLLAERGRAVISGPPSFFLSHEEE